MNSRTAGRRRFRVVARPQARARRARLLASFAAVGILGALAVAAARHAAGSFARPSFSLPALAPAADAAVVVDGVPEPLKSLAQAAADAAKGSAGEKAAALLRQFPCLSDVKVSRPWGQERSTLTPVPRRAVAPALRRGRSAGFLSDDGVVFAAPDGVYAPAGPGADVDGAEPSELKTLAGQWPALSAPGAFPAPLARMTYVPGKAGDAYWEASLTDGTVVAWGGLDWTKEKLTRLGEALADARAKAPGAYAADLRWFADGKVLLRPAGPALAAGAHGGVK